MKRLFVVWLAFGSVAGQDCGRSHGAPKLSEKIVGGYDVGYYKYPWFASLLLNGDSWCGGTLIGSNVVVTAAHCYTDNIKPGAALEDLFTVKLGGYDSCSKKEKTQEQFNVAKVHIHQKYSENHTYFDIALIILSGNSSSFEPICLPPSAIPDVKRGRVGIIIGLGTTKYGANRFPCKLREGRILLYLDKICKRMLKKATTDVADHPMTNAFCAGYIKGKVDSCQGDSGGPLMVQDKNGRYVLLGVASFGYGCAKRNLPSLYTDVSQYLEWIEKTAAVRLSVPSESTHTALNQTIKVLTLQQLKPLKPAKPKKGKKHSYGHRRKNQGSNKKIKKY